MKVKVTHPKREIHAATGLLLVPDAEMDVTEKQAESLIRAGFASRGTSPRLGKVTEKLVKPAEKAEKVKE